MGRVEEDWRPETEGGRPENLDNLPTPWYYSARTSNSLCIYTARSGDPASLWLLNNLFTPGNSSSLIALQYPVIWDAGWQGLGSSNRGEAAARGNYPFNWEFITRRGLTPTPKKMACHPSPVDIGKCNFPRYPKQSKRKQVISERRGEGSHSMGSDSKNYSSGIPYRSGDPASLGFGTIRACESPIIYYEWKIPDEKNS